MKYLGINGESEAQFEPTQAESDALSLVCIALANDQQRRGDYRSGPHGIAMVEHAVRKLRGQLDADLSLPPGVKGCVECAQQYAALVAAAAIRFITDVSLKHVANSTAVEPPVIVPVGSVDLSLEDLERIRDSFAQHGRATVQHANGTKQHFLGTPTGAYAAAAERATLQRGPHHAEDEIGFGKPYDSLGG